MLTLIKGARVYTPQYIGIKDVLLSFDRIAAISDPIDTGSLPDVERVDGRGKLLVPGFIDQHVHITGGGGEGGFSTRTQEIDIQDLLKAGITTVVGVLGTDGITRNLEGLYAKAGALEEQGITSYIYTGSYSVPPVTFTGEVDRDLVLIDKVIGVGEIALADHRSSQPSREELIRIATQARVGGLLSGKAGIVHLHMGSHPSGLGLVMEILECSAIPVTQFIPTHINRTQSLFMQALDFCKRGGRVDLTAGFRRDENSPDCLSPGEALEGCLEAGINGGSISMSSDGNGSIPVFDEGGKLIGIDTASCYVLLEDLRMMVVQYGISLETALRTVTTNPASILGIGHKKGQVAIGWDADCILLDEGLEVKDVFARGKRMVRDGDFTGV